MALFAVSLLNAPAAYTQGTDRINGTVVDVSGAYIPNASVTLFSDEFIRAGTADQNGRFDFDNLRQAPMNLEVSAPGFKTRTMTNFQGGGFGPFVVVLQVGSCPQCLTVTQRCLTVMPPFRIVPPKVSYEERGGDVNVAGKIVDAFRGPLSKAAVVLVNSAAGLYYVTETGESGEFQFTDIDPGKYQMRTTYDNPYRTLATFLVARENLTRIDGVYLFSEEKYTKICATDVNTESSPLPIQLISPK